MPWDPPVVLGGDSRPVRVSASDVASPSPCGRFLALKTRPQVRTVSGWGRLFPPNSEPAPFPLGDVTDIVAAAHDASGVDTYAGLMAWITGRVDRLGVHRLTRPYVESAVEFVLEVHEAIEGEVGPLTVLRRDPRVFGSGGGEVWVWGLLYGTRDGVREVRRLRVGSVHDVPDEDDARWVATAAYVAAGVSGGVPCTRVRVVEIGCGDGSVAVLFDGPPDHAVSGFQGPTRDRALELLEQDHLVPCFDCGQCKSAGSCPALAPA